MADAPVSDQHAPGRGYAPGVWRRFALASLGVFFIGLGIIYAALIVLDPYDTGRFPTFMHPGVTDIEQRTASASHGRNPAFDAAIFGNSRGQLLDPARLSALTKLEFVQLTTPGSGPREQTVLMQYFIAHHEKVDAVVLAVDERWCDHDPALSVRFPFPFWLYRGNVEYLANLLNTRSISFARNRIRLMRGMATPGNRRGYRDYETGKVWNFHPHDAWPVAPASGPPPKPNGFFPAMRLLDDALARLPAQTPVVILMPPVYRTMLPVPNSQIAADLPACKAAFAARVAGRPRSAFLDFLLDTPISHDPANFMDHEHYRHVVAQMLERRIAAVLLGSDEPPGAGAGTGSPGMR